MLGFDGHKAMFARAIDDRALVHAYLFSGPDRIGKRTFAIDCARRMHPDVVPGVSDLDYYVLAPRVAEGESHISIEDIRAMRRWVALRPTAAASRVVLIDDADRMTADAANALLKVLEEPPAYAHFFLISAYPETLPDTVRSRCQAHAFHAHPAALVERVISDGGVSAADAALVRDIADGRIGRVLPLIRTDGIAACAEDVALLENLSRRPLAERLVAAKKLSDRDDALELARLWLSWAHAHLSDAGMPARARALLSLSETLMHPQYNARLAFERFMLDLDN